MEHASIDEHPSLVSVAEPTMVDGVALYERGPVEPTEHPAIVLVHGGMHGAWIWTDVQEWLATNGWRSIAFDWYSHGRSDPLPPDRWADRSIVEVSHEVGVACRAVDDGGAPPVVIGHSMGALAALAHAASGPERLGALVLLAPVVPEGFAAASIPVDDIDPGRPYGPFPFPFARELFYDGLAEQEALRWAAHLQPESPTAVLQALRFTAQVDLARVTVPMLAFAAERDRLVPPAYVRALADATGAGYVHLPGIGHGIPVNPGWQQVMAMVTQWIDLTEILAHRVAE